MATQPTLIELAPLTTEEAAARLDTAKSTVVRWVAAGHITPLRQMPGRYGGYLFAPAEVERVKRATWPNKRTAAGREAARQGAARRRSA